MLVYKPMLFLFLKQCARTILSFSHNKLITSYGSERVPSDFIRQLSDGMTHDTVSIQLVAFDILLGATSWMKTIGCYQLVGKSCRMPYLTIFVV